MLRYRVRSGAKTFRDPGPDLLRTRPNARRQVRSVLGDRKGGWFTRVDGREDGEWKGPMSKADAVAKFDAWKAPLGEFLFGQKDGRKIEAQAVCRVENVRELEVPNCSQGVSTNWSLAKHQFPDCVFAGGYVYKQILGTNEWSDHAWGDAVDETPKDNDALFDWNTRMARSGNMDYDYLLGSRKGKVVQSSAPDFDVEPSSAASSHLWHNHMSVIDHDGRKPPREGGRG